VFCCDIVKFPGIKVICYQWHFFTWIFLKCTDFSHTHTAFHPHTGETNYHVSICICKHCSWVQVSHGAAEPIAVDDVRCSHLLFGHLAFIANGRHRLPPSPPLLPYAHLPLPPEIHIHRKRRHFRTWRVLQINANFSKTFQHSQKKRTE